MQTNISLESKSQAPAMPLRAIVEIVDGELRIFPVVQSDGDEKRIIDALRLSVEGHR